MECRRTAEDRKNYFESMERHMFARGSSVKETGRESISTSEQQASSVEDGERGGGAGGGGRAHRQAGVPRRNGIGGKYFKYRVHPCFGPTDVTISWIFFRTKYTDCLPALDPAPLT